MTSVVPSMQQRLALRHHLLQSVRATCTAAGLYEIETPLLGRATPEGARDFLVPSRIYPWQFLCLAAISPAHEAAADDGGF